MGLCSGWTRSSLRWDRLASPAHPCPRPMSSFARSTAKTDMLEKRRHSLHFGECVCVRAWMHVCVCVHVCKSLASWSLQLLLHFYVEAENVSQDFSLWHEFDASRTIQDGPLHCCYVVLLPSPPEETQSFILIVLRQMSLFVSVWRAEARESFPQGDLSSSRNFKRSADHQPLLKQEWR